MTRIYFVRHGETLWNQERRYQGQCDSPLSPEGIRQAEQVADFLRPRKLEAVYSSDLTRALLTAEHIAAHHDKKPTVDKRLREMSFGVWEGLTRTEVKKEYAELFQARYQDSLTTRIPGGELPTEVVARFEEFLHERLARHEGKTIAIVSHGGTLRFIIAKLLHMPLEKSYCLQLSNAGLSEFRYRTDESHCWWEAHSINSTGHLV